MWSPGGDIYMQTSSNSGLTWDKPKVGLLCATRPGQCTLCACVRTLCRQASLGALHHLWFHAVRVQVAQPQAEIITPS